MKLTLALRSRMDALASRGRFPRETIDRFAGALEQLPAREATRINPLAFAARFGLADDEAVALFVTGAKVGLFELEWDLVCPLCGAITDAPERMDAIPEEAFHCGFCNRAAPAILDDHVEATFTLPAQLGGSALDPFLDLESYLGHLTSRAYPHLDHWIDYHRRHTLAESRMTPGRKVVLKFQAAPDTIHRLVCMDNHITAALQTGDASRQTVAPQAIALRLDRDGVTPHQLAISPGPVALTLHNLTGQRVWARILTVCPGEIMAFLAKGPPPFAPRLTAKRLLTHQTFRDLFATQAFIPDLRLRLRDITLLFTDLKGSTGLYERAGDMEAFRLVHEHFKRLKQSVREHSGAVVKTMGDAVMAAFANPLDGVRASIDMMARIDAFADVAHPEEIALKVGLHAGPALTVNAGDVLDYFGQTVNIAARVQGEAQAGEICLTGAVRNAPQACEAMQAAGFAESRFEAALKGMTEKTEIHRFVKSGA